MNGTNSGAIETKYKGYRFRSRLEARWAVFFDALGLPWEYEKEGYALGTGLHEINEDFEVDPRAQIGDLAYLPDFWLPTLTLRGLEPRGIFLEIKGREASDEEQEKCQRLGKLTGHGVALVVGLPDETGVFEQFLQIWPWWDCDMRLMRCHTCKEVKLEFPEGSYEICPKCGKRCDQAEPGLLSAFNAARSARFEFLGN